MLSEVSCCQLNMRETQSMGADLSQRQQKEEAHMQSRPQREAHCRDVDDGCKDAPLFKHLLQLLEGAHEEHCTAVCTHMGEH